MARRTPPMLSDGCIVQFRPSGPKQQRSEQTFDQAAAGDASGAVRHLDLRLAKLDLGRRAVADDGRLQAGHARVVAIALRCS